MAKINITFNNNSYSIDESTLATAVSDLETVLSGLASGGNVETITVWIGDACGEKDSVGITAEVGMTWAEFIDSEYNSENIISYHSDESVPLWVNGLGSLYVYSPEEDNEIPVQLTDVIGNYDYYGGF